MRFHIYTFGCRVNAAESAKIAMELQELGFIYSPMPQAKILIINSCAVTQKAVREVRQLINKAKTRYPKLQVWLTGCVASFWQKTGELPAGVDYLVGNEQKSIISRLIAKSVKPTHFSQNKPVWGKFLSSSRLMVKVQDGCDYFCSYCIVPYLRGRSVSLEPSDVLGYIKKIAKVTPINEVVLTGINLGLYQTKNNHSFDSLVSQVLKQTALPKISFGSLYTENLTEAFFDLYRSKQSLRLTRYLHIPLQSGSGEILQLMRRRYSLAEFDERVQALAKAVPDALLATDIIVGFLNETDKDFMATYQYLEKSPFVRAHIFKYSPRQFTSAYYLAKKFGEVDSEVKKKRSRKLHLLFQKKLALYQQNLINRSLRALVIKSNSQHSLAFLDNGLEVVIPKPNLVVGLRNVKISRVEKGKLIANLV